MEGSITPEQLSAAERAFRLSAQQVQESKARSADYAEKHPFLYRAPNALALGIPGGIAGGVIGRGAGMFLGKPGIGTALGAGVGAGAGAITGALASPTAGKLRQDAEGIGSSLRSLSSDDVQSGLQDANKWWRGEKVAFLQKVALLPVLLPAAAGGLAGYRQGGLEGARQGAIGATKGALKGGAYETGVGAAGGAAGGALFGGVGAAPGAAMGGATGMLTGVIGGGMKGYKEQMEKMRSESAETGAPMPNTPPIASAGARMAAVR